MRQVPGLTDEAFRTAMSCGSHLCGVGSEPPGEGVSGIGISFQFVESVGDHLVGDRGRRSHLLVEDSR
jgi:hypothetical protein